MLAIGCVFAPTIHSQVTFGMEYGIGALNRDDVDAGNTAFLMPMLILESRAFYVELGVPFWSNTVNDEFGIHADLTIRATNNIALSQEGTLGLMLESSIMIFPTDYFITPMNHWPVRKGDLFRRFGSNGEDFDMALGLGARYTHTFNGTTFFSQVAFPFNLFGNGEWTNDPFYNVGFDIVLGINTETGFGLAGIELDFRSLVRQWGGDGDADIFHNIVLTPFVEFGPIDARLAVNIPTDDTGRRGVFLRPEVSLWMWDGLRVYFALPISSVGGDPDSISGLSMGVLLRF